MTYEKIYLKEYFPFLGESDSDPVLECYRAGNLTEMNRKDKRPCLLICPGGAYAFCSQREAEPIAMHFLSENYHVFVLTYSIAPYRFPTQLREVAAAMELIYQNAEEWLCDTEHIAIMGFSAGGHLAAHYSTQYDCKEVRAVFPQSKPVQASILCYPVITADWSFTHQGSMLNLLGHQPDEQETLRFSNEKNVTETTPPAFLWHTASDETVPVENSMVYASALMKHNIPVELHIYPKGDHGLATCDEITCDNVTEDIRHAHQWLDSVKVWLKRYVR